ncbi:hypothetical protein GMMP15_1900015 [Candidatus Magnetomoraceae bacterium gMMP-15]
MKHKFGRVIILRLRKVLITYPLKQGLKLLSFSNLNCIFFGSNYLSTKTRIETFQNIIHLFPLFRF